MKLVSLALLLTSGASTALAAVAAPLTSLEAVDFPAINFAPNIPVRPIGRIECRTTDPEKNMPTELFRIRRTQIPYLYERNLKCDIRPGPDGYGRVSCSKNAGIFIRQQNISRPIPFRCDEVAEWAHQIVKRCGDNDLVLGAAHDRFEDFSVEIFFEKC
ncbi:hypothetical protein QBC34DRAFT_392415 [Podospora aff. communis PSN243]|uniref:Ecp2 effector protein domain-containing protein n=1 Tax=Podospora aff. communis PSN243 TaxID=3040156 RepID=A0AAV9H1Q2_9PEZI|nr:hypothetical protein QBC34DRAFT_392415 [Podospora aff. communis PSN243]